MKMTYQEFIEFVQTRCMHETIYEDGEGRLILVVDMLDAYSMVNKISKSVAFIDSKLSTEEPQKNDEVQEPRQPHQPG